MELPARRLALRENRRLACTEIGAVVPPGHDDVSPRGLSFIHGPFVTMLTA